MTSVFDNAPSLVERLRDVDEVNAFIVRREAADWIEKLVRVASACQDLPLWKMEQYGAPREDFEAVTRLRDALDGLIRGNSEGGGNREHLSSAKAAAAPSPEMERDWPTEIREWADLELPATEAFLLEVADAFQKFAGLHAESRRLADALAEIELKSRWYADNEARDPQEVDHALCVEILDLAERALNE